jgi:hypothetical protein
MRRSVIPIILAALFSLLSLGAAATPARTPSPKTPAPAVLKVLPPLHGIYHAAFPDFCPEESCVDVSRLQAFDALAGKPVAWAYFSNNWFQGIHFPLKSIQMIWSVNRTVPFIRLMPRGSWETGCQDKAYPLPEILSGRFDAQLRQYARDAAATKIPLMIDFAPEANGNWFPWSAVCWGGAKGAHLYALTLRHLITLFRSEGAWNVTWVLHLNAGGSPVASWNRAASYYPGASYVDWVGLSAYGEDVPGEGWRSLDAALKGPYADMVKAAPGKPFALFETGTVEDPPNSKADWVSAAFSSILSNRYPALKAVSWWSSNFANDNGVPASLLRIDSDPQALAAYQQAISSPVFVGKARIGR